MRRLTDLAMVLCTLAVTAHASERPAVQGGVYDKPYLKGTTGGTAVGGYIDHELFWNEKKKTFDQHRFIPFLFSEVSDGIHVSAEIEFEHGGNVDGDGEVKLEYATLDITFHEAATFRGGVILSPLGRFNLIHDSPLNDLTNRPLMAREIIPTTLSESGMGLFGTLYPSETAVVGYELYLVNGFGEAAATRIRSGRGSQKQDNNEDKSIVGRLNYSPALGLDVGGSFHVGAYDDAGDHNLSILAADASWNDSFWKHDRFNELLLKGRSELDQKKRRAIYVEMQTIVHNDGGVVVPMFANYVFAMADKVKHRDKMAANWGLDGNKGLERWWMG